MLGRPDRVSKVALAQIAASVLESSYTPMSKRGLKLTVRQLNKREAKKDSVSH